MRSIHVGEGDEALDQRLSDELGAGNPFTFQAPGFHDRHGYLEFARWRDVPVAGQDDVHLRKELVPAAG